MGASWRPVIKQCATGSLERRFCFSRFVVMSNCVIRTLEASEKWPRAKVLTLIDLLKAREVLWNCNNVDYKNKVSREKAMKEIETELGLYSRDEIKSKIHTLRSQWRKETRTIAQSYEYGLGADEIYVPKLWCYEQLTFLNDCDLPRDSSTNYEFNEMSSKRTEEDFFRSNASSSDVPQGRERSSSESSGSEEIPAISRSSSLMSLGSEAEDSDQGDVMIADGCSISSQELQTIKCKMAALTHYYKLCHVIKSKIAPDTSSKIPGKTIKVYNLKAKCQKCFAEVSFWNNTTGNLVSHYKTKHKHDLFELKTAISRTSRRGLRHPTGEDQLESFGQAPRFTQDIVQDILQEVLMKRPAPSPTPSTSSHEGSKEKRSLQSIDEAIQLTLDALQREGKASDGFSLLVREKMANLNIDQRELAEELIIKVLRLARQEKLTSDHQILAIAPVNAHF